MKAKGHLLTLDPRTIVGAMYLAGTNDGTTQAGDLACPVLYCAEISMDNPLGIHAKRSLKPPKSHQTIWIPYSAIVLIVDHEHAEDIPFGFVPSPGSAINTT
jgi:hypothetical protein